MSDTRFEALLRTRIGLDPDSIGRAFIERAIDQRVSESGCASRDAYWTRLSESDDEQHSLTELVVVPETWFFRYPDALAECGRSVLRMRARSSARPIRVLSLPCSTGEEPYSIAMALLDQGVPKSDFVIDALDVSARALERARRGRYGRNAFRSDDLSFRDRHFVTTDQGDVIGSHVRGCVTFRQENMFALSDETLRQPYDIVFCRNLLIYLDATAQGRALSILMRLCRPAGVLFAGPAEANLLSRAGYETCGTLRAFAFSRPTVQTRGHEVPLHVLRDVNLPAVPSAMAWPLSTPPEKHPERRSACRATAATARSAAAQPLRPLPSSEAAPRQDVAPPGASAELGTSGTDDTARYAWIQALADSGRVEQAARAAQHAMQTDGSQAHLFYLLALCQDAQGDIVNALKNYRKTLYLDPHHIAALSHLAAVLEGQGDGVGASRLRQRAAREEARRV